MTADCGVKILFFAHDPPVGKTVFFGRLRRNVRFGLVAGGIS